LGSAGRPTRFLINHGGCVDLNKAARIGREANDLNRRRRRLGLAEIFRPDTIERVLIAEIGDKAIGGDNIGEGCAGCLQAALEIFERRPRLPSISEGIVIRRDLLTL